MNSVQHARGKLSPLRKDKLFCAFALLVASAHGLEVEVDDLAWAKATVEAFLDEWPSVREMME